MKTTQQRAHWVVLLLFLAPLAGSAQADIVLNGSFENGSFAPDGNGFMSLPPGSTAITNWTTFNAELVWTNDSNISGFPASDGHFFLDLSGYHDASPYGGIKQTLITVAGDQYRVTFDLGLDQSTPGSTGPITVRVAATGSLFEDFTYNPPGGGIQWGAFEYNFTATTVSTELSFLGISGGRAMELDNVEVQGVPEPATWLAGMFMAIVLTFYCPCRTWQTR